MMGLLSLYLHDENVSARMRGKNENRLQQQNLKFRFTTAKSTISTIKFSSNRTDVISPNEFYKEIYVEKITHLNQIK